MYCKHCGKPIDKDSVFCTHCGKQLSEIGGDNDVIETHHVKDEEKPVSQTNQYSYKKEEGVSKGRTSTKSHKKIYLLCFIVVICVFMLWGLLSLFGNNIIADITIDKVSEELAQATKRYDRLYDFHEGLARVEKNDKYGFIDKLGHEIIPCKYEKAYDFEIGIAVVKIGEKEGAIDKQGNIVIPIMYDNLCFDKDSTASASLNEKCGRINIKGETIIPFDYEYCGSFCEGLAVVRQNGLYGFVNREGSIVISCQYEDTYDYGAYGFSEGLAGVKKDEYYGYIDHDGKVVIPFSEGITGEPFSDGVAPIIKWTTVQSDSGQSPFPSFHSVRRTGKMAYMDKAGRVLTEFRQWNCRGFRNGYAYVQDDNTHYCGLINRHGIFVIPFGEYAIIGTNYDGFVRVSRGNERCGFFNLKTGMEAIPCIYEDMPYTFSEGLVSAKKNGKWGFVNSSNETVIPFIYDDADNFSEGFAVIERFGKYGYVDRYGSDTFSIK